MPVSMTPTTTSRLPVVTSHASGASMSASGVGPSPRLAGVVQAPLRGVLWVVRHTGIGGRVYTVVGFGVENARVALQFLLEREGVGRIDLRQRGVEAGKRHARAGPGGDERAVLVFLRHPGVEAYDQFALNYVGVFRCLRSDLRLNDRRQLVRCRAELAGDERQHERERRSHVSSSRM